MYSIILQGGFETETPEEFISALKQFIQENKAEMFGKLFVQQLPLDVDYQKIE